MRSFIALLIMLGIAVQLGSGYILKSDVLSSGGIGMNSSSYIAKGTLSQMTASNPWLTTPGYRAIIGFWHPYPPGPGIEEKFGNQDQIQLRYFLYPNTPNPVMNSTTIRYSIAKKSKVVLEVFNTLGQKVTTLIDREQPAGSYNVTWDIQTCQIPAGVYFFRLRAGDYEKIRKMIILKNKK